MNLAKFMKLLVTRAYVKGVKVNIVVKDASNVHIYARIVVKCFMNVIFVVPRVKV